MRHLDKARGALLAGLCTLGAPLYALADDPGSGAPQRDTQMPATEPKSEAPQAQQGMKPEGKTTEGKANEEKQRALGAGVGGPGSCGGQGFVIGPLETGAEKGYGAGIGPGEIAEPGQKGVAPIPQYWLADASLFVANA